MSAQDTGKHGPRATAEYPVGPGATAGLAPVTKVRLAAEILAAYGQVRWALRRDDLPSVVARLRAPRRAARPRPLPNAAGDGRRLGTAVVKTLERLPADSRCLMRSLVLLRLLARRGVAGSLVIAVRPSEQLTLAAHAWVEVDGHPVLVPAARDQGRLVTL
jgi:hypothetical protein